MHRTTGQGNVSNMFVAENVNTSQPPTEITADWMNAVQEEICAVIEDADLTLNANNNAQLLQAIGVLIGNSFATMTESAKWDAFPVGHKEPFIPEIMGVNITTWLAAHPKWGKLDNSVVADIEGRVLAVASSAHAAGTQIGSDDASVVEHTHTATQASHTHSVNDPGHSHTGKSDDIGNIDGGGAGIYHIHSSTSNSTSSAVTNITLQNSTPTIAVNNAGEIGVGKNIQRTHYCDWIYKHS